MKISVSLALKYNIVVDGYSIVFRRRESRALQASDRSKIPIADPRSSRPVLDHMTNDRIERFGAVGNVIRTDRKCCFEIAAGTIALGGYTIVCYYPALAISAVASQPRDGSKFLKPHNM